MSRSARPTFAAVAACLGLGLSGCAYKPGQANEAGGQLAVEGVIIAIDTQPWTYDGNAVVEVETDARDRVPVQLPARWNLCLAAPVDVDALSIGMRVQALGGADGEGGLVVCQDAAHRLVPMD